MAARSLLGGLAPRQCRLDLALTGLGVGCDRAQLRGEAAICSVICATCCDSRLPFARELQLLLEPGDLGVRSVERALPLVQSVASLEMLGAQRLQPVFGGAQVGLQRFEAGGQIGDFG